MAEGDDIPERLINFAVAIIALSSSLRKTEVGRHLSGQLLGSGTSPAPNYGEAPGVESTKESVHKLGDVLKEGIGNLAGNYKTNEMSPIETFHSLQLECTEFFRIIASSIRTVGKSKD